MEAFTQNPLRKCTAIDIILDITVEHGNYLYTLNWLMSSFFTHSSQTGNIFLKSKCCLFLFTFSSWCPYIDYLRGAAHGKVNSRLSLSLFFCNHTRNIFKNNTIGKKVVIKKWSCFYYIFRNLFKDFHLLYMFPIVILFVLCWFKSELGNLAVFGSLLVS